MHALHQLECLRDNAVVHSALGLAIESIIWPCALAAGNTSSQFAVAAHNMRVTTLKGAQRVVSACMAAPVRKAAALPSTPAAAVASCIIPCSSSQMQRSAMNQLGSSSSVSRCRMQQLGMRALATPAVEVRQGPPAPPKDQVLTQDAGNNVTEYIYSKMGINLHHQPNHPIGIIKQVRYMGCRGTCSDEWALGSGHWLSLKLVAGPVRKQGHTAAAGRAVVAAAGGQKKLCCARLKCRCCAHIQCVPAWPLTTSICSGVPTGCCLLQCRLCTPALKSTARLHHTSVRTLIETLTDT